MTTISNNQIANAIYLASNGKIGTHLHGVLNNAVQVISRRHLMSKSSDILKHLENIINIKESKIVAKVISAKSLTEHFKKQLVHSLKERYSAKEILLLESLDKSLLGGCRIEVGDEVIDLTMKDKFNKLQAHLIKK